jgi:CubicO group peptidase (beta-lactamase class C family)
LHGVSHDPNSAALDGVAGHAGMFSSARDWRRSRRCSDGAQIRRKKAAFLKPTTVQQFIRRAAKGRGLGWDLAVGPNKSAGQFASERTFGHTGFTGTSLWIDPERDYYVVLLTNRILPTARNTDTLRCVKQFTKPQRWQLRT